jgi:hypothetical protein
MPSKLKSFSNANFYSNLSDESLIFYVPDHGARTSGSQYSRCELRNLREWTMQGEEVNCGSPFGSPFYTIHTLRGSLKILEVPASGKIVFSQIHGVVKGSECLKMSWDNGNITVHTKSTFGDKADKILDLPGLRLGDMIEYRISISNYQLNVTVNGIESNTNFDNSWKDQKFYFKAGNCLQDNSNSGTCGKVAYYRLSDDNETSNEEYMYNVQISNYYF